MGIYLNLIDFWCSKAKKDCSSIDPKFRNKLQQLNDEFDSFSVAEIVSYVYTKYPEWNPSNNR